MYLILLLAWLLKISTPLSQPEGVHLGWRETLLNMLSSAAAGPVPSVVVIIGLTLFYIGLGWMVLQTDYVVEANAGQVHV
jgi:uncharacterized membrane protein